MYKGIEVKIDMNGLEEQWEYKLNKQKIYWAVGDERKIAQF